MTDWLIDSIIAGASFVLIYRLVLEMRTAFRFNRIYLLCMLILANTLPFVTLPVVQHEYHVPIGMTQITSAVQTGKSYIINKIETQVEKPVGESGNILLWAYVSITILMATRFVLNLNAIRNLIRSSTRLQKDGYTIVLTAKDIQPHSFFHYIFFPADNWNSKRIANELLLHELAHVRNLHSLDVLLAEFVMVFTWFNPFNFLLRKYISENHEYLADDQVVKSTADISTYQLLLLEYSRRHSPVPVALSSGFTYSIIKKRFAMMTTKFSTVKAYSAAFVSAGLVITLCALITLKSFSQKAPEGAKAAENSPANNTAGASAEELAEFDAGIARIASERAKNPAYVAEGMPRLGFIFKGMSAEQRKSRNPTVFGGTFVEPTPEYKRIPSEKELNYWESANKVQVTVDGQTVENAVLKNYRAHDFQMYFYRKLSAEEKSAPALSKFNYALKLYTTGYYRKRFSDN
jgi:bla regulator protein blaR1